MDKVRLGRKSEPGRRSFHIRMFEQTFKNIDDVLWKEAGCTTELDYTEQTSWVLFLKYLDDLEHERAMAADLAGKLYTFIIDKPHRWSSWAGAYTKSR
jgi:type I restriction enzyme M protein